MRSERCGSKKALDWLLNVGVGSPHGTTEGDLSIPGSCSGISSWTSQCRGWTVSRTAVITWMYLTDRQKLSEGAAVCLPVLLRSPTKVKCIYLNHGDEQTVVFTVNGLCFSPTFRVHNYVNHELFVKQNECYYTEVTLELSLPCHNFMSQHETQLKRVGVWWSRWNPLSPRGQVTALSSLFIRLLFNLSAESLIFCNVLVRRRRLFRLFVGKRWLQVVQSFFP